MMKNKLVSYLGFAQKSGNLIRGYSKCLALVEKQKVKLLIVAEDMSRNTMKKMVQKCRSSGTDYRIFGGSEVLSQVTGAVGNGIFAVMDDNFAKVISREIDRIQSEGVCDGKKGL